MPLSDEFMTCLLNGHLSSLREYLQYDATLSPEIREDTLSVYYRGGRLLSITRNGKDYPALFDPQYFNGPLASTPAFNNWKAQANSLPDNLNTLDAVTKCLTTLPLLKSTMDLWFGAHRPLERESVQRLVRENNRDAAVGTDYFICDVECVQHLACGEDARLDFVAVHWPSNAPRRANPHQLGLVLGEAKFGAGAIKGIAGLVSHMKHVAALVNDPNGLAALKQKMLQVFNQKLQLGLIQNQKQIASFSDERPTWLLVFANHDPASRLLRDAIGEVSAVPNFPARIKIAVANFMGYGLYDQALYDIGDFRTNFDNHIHS